MFDRLIGNELIKSQISEMVSGNRLPHAMIIEGEDGLGKHTLAAIIAAAAICEQSNAPCGKCRVCDLVARYVHPDVCLYSPQKSTFKVDTVRTIRNDAYVMPLEAKRRVFILEHTELMNKEAENALLKVLEEPPGTAIFILLTMSASQLLPTIRSRCITFSLQEPSLEQATEYIKSHTDFESEDIEKTVTECGNNIGRSLEILNNGKALQIQNAWELFGAVTNGKKLDALKVCCKVESDRLAIDSLLSEFRRILTDEFKKSACGNFNKESTQNISKMIDIVDEIIVAAKSNCNKALLLTTLCARLCET
ncbi:MAG: hypothetical protein PHV07_03020 [Oscillospiraceae bacterium]|nr:hypothetical protein [Oscillospiraceae bacterium]